MLDLQAIRRAVDPKAPATGNVHCPLHDDSKPSLSVSVGNGDRLLVRCRAGCDQLAVFDEVRKRAGSLLNGHRCASGKSSETVYTYRNAAGEPIARVVRQDTASGEKKIWQETPDGTGWIKKGVRGATPLYRLDVLASRPVQPSSSARARRQPRPHNAGSASGSSARPGWAERPTSARPI